MTMKNKKIYNSQNSNVGKQLSIFTSDDAMHQPNVVDKNLILGSDKNDELKSEQWSVFIDGAARGNPGPAGCGIYALKNQQEELIKKGFFLGEKTNNQAEYIALLIAIFLIGKKQKEQNLNGIPLTVYSDSELLVRQMQGLYKVKNPFILSVKNLVENMLSNIPCNFVHIVREKNKIADRLANLGVDKKVQPPKDFWDFVAGFNEIMATIKN